MIPRTTSNMTTNTDDTATAMVDVSEVSDIGMLARMLVDVVILVLRYIYIYILGKQKH